MVDPGDAQPVLDALTRERVQLQTILVTHHHADHVGGVETLRRATGAAVFGPARESIPAPYTPMQGGDHLQSLGLDFSVIDVPGHTAGHIAYFCADAKPAPLLFCGDALFSGGCGRIFEGTPEQMLASLERLAALPAQTQVCCAHEYTLGNLQFARVLDPTNTRLAEYSTQCEWLRSKGLPTLPSTIALERAINPFLRSHLPELYASAMRHDPQRTRQAGAFAALRHWKNTYQ